MIILKITLLLEEYKKRICKINNNVVHAHQALDLAKI